MTAEALNELKEGRRQLYVKAKQLAAEELKLRPGFKAEIVDGYTMRGKKMVKMKNLIDVVCDRVKRDGAYASLAVGKEVD